MTLIERREYVRALLEEQFHTRKEAVQNLVEMGELQEQSAQTFVYGMFSGPRYSDAEILKRARNIIREQ